MKQATKAKGEIVKTTIRVPKELWTEVRQAGIGLDLSAQEIVAYALRSWLGGAKSKKRGK